MKCLICHMRDRASNNLEALPCLGKPDPAVIWDCSWIPPGPTLTHVLRLIHTISNSKCLKKGKQVSIPRWVYSYPEKVNLCFAPASYQGDRTATSLSGQLGEAILRGAGMAFLKGPKDHGRSISKRVPLWKLEGKENLSVLQGGCCQVPFCPASQRNLYLLPALFIASFHHLHCPFDNHVTCQGVCFSPVGHWFFPLVEPQTFLRI